MIKITPYNKNVDLCEIYETGFQFALVSKNNEQCHEWVLCKDFLTDVIYATLHNVSIEIYGLAFSNRNPKISLNPLRLMVRNKELENPEFDRQIQKSLEFLNIVEAKLKFNLSTIEKVEHKSFSTWIFTLEKRWIHAPPMISMLALFIRVGCYYKDGLTLNQAMKEFKSCGHNDSSYLKQSRNLRRLIMRKNISIFKPEIIDNYPKSDISHVHSEWGIVSIKNAKHFQTLWNLEELNKEKTQPKITASL